MKKIHMPARLLALLLCLALLAAAGCGVLPSEGGGDVPGEDSSIVGDSQSGSDEGDKQYPEGFLNDERSYIMAAGFTRPSEINGNFFQFKIGTPMNILYEGMFCLVRTTDTIVPRLCESYEQDGNRTIFHLRKNAGWSDGEPFTSRDVKAYFDVNYTHSLLTYLESVEYPDEYTVVIEWAEPMINTDIGMLFVADGWHGTIAYHLYKEYADRAAVILDEAIAAKKSGERGPGPYGVTFTEEQSAALGAIWNEFVASGPALPVGTGPYRIESMTDTDMVMVKNPYYYDAENVAIEKLVLKNLDANTSLAMLSNGELDHYGGVLGEDITDNLLDAMPNLRFYPMFDPACQGLFFNTRKAPFDQLELRQAIAMLLDKTPIRQTTSVYSKEYPEISSLGIVPSTLSESVSAGIVDSLKDYTRNEPAAEALLTGAGWSRNDEGKWQDADGQSYTWEIVVGPNSGSAMLNGAAIIADQMNKFGFTVTVVGSEAGTFYEKASLQEHDMLIDFTDVSWSFVNPYSTITNYYNGDPGKWAGLWSDDQPKSLLLTDQNGEEFDVYELIGDMYWMTPDEMQRAVDRIVWATNENAYCVNLYQQTVGVWQNTDRIGNLPMEHRADGGNFMPLPESLEDRIAVAKLNLGFAAAGLMFDDGITPK